MEEIGQVCYLLKSSFVDNIMVILVNLHYFASFVPSFFSIFFQVDF